MIRDQIRDEYFESLVCLVCRNRFVDGISYRRLLSQLHMIPFRWIIPADSDRAERGKDLRWRFALAHGYEDCYRTALEGPCSVLEMMVALALFCEEQIMSDTAYGDRTAQWFWGMAVNMGLGTMTDDRFDRRYVIQVVDRMLDRQYEPDGKGGLFRIRNCDKDVRTMEIWHQLCHYLDTFV